MILHIGVLKFVPIKMKCLLLVPMLMIQPKDVYLNVQISHGHMLRMTRERVYIDALMTHLVRTQPVNVYKIVRIGVHSQRMIQHFV